MKKNIIVILSIILFISVQICIAYFLTGTGGYSFKSTNIGYKSTTVDVEGKYSKTAIKNYDEYQDLIDYYEIDDSDLLSESDLKSYDYIVDSFTLEESCGDKFSKISNLEIIARKIDITYDIESQCGLCGPATILVLIPVKKDKISDEYTINQHLNPVNTEDDHCDPNVIMKPILYLYPTKETNINVTIAKSDAIISSYPKYINNWNVTASPNGDLFDKDGKFYYALYWDETNYAKVNFDKGFYVSKDNAINFLEEKLSIIGLNDRERNEFIMYWLPILEKNENSLVYFELTDERQSNNELVISPKPDSLLRVNIHVKKVNGEKSISEQKLPSFNRTGFSAIEWGGTIHE